MRTMVPISVLALLAACGGGSGGGQTLSCDTINGGGATTTAAVDPGCAGCSVTDEQNASDDSARSFARMTSSATAPEQGTRIRSTAQSGIVFPAGNNVGAFVTFPSGSNGVSVNGTNVVTIATYLSGGVQESASAGETTSVGGPALEHEDLPTGGDDTLPQDFLSFRTTEPFDAVEIAYGAPGARTDAPTLKVFGLCSDGRAG